MAMINCSECNREISDKATSCPGCGAPAQTQKMVDNKPKETYSTLAIVTFGLGVCSILLPYFAAVLVVPAALICGVIVFLKGLKGVGITSIILALIGLFHIISVSEKINDAQGVFERSMERY